MKKLQSNFTMPEQSKRLLELGVPEDSADCYYNEKDYAHPKFVPIGYSFIEYCSNAFGHIKEDYEPCWSVGRLIEIMRICSKETNISFVFSNTDGLTIIGNIIRCVQLGIECGRMDFSKLEL